MKKFKFAALGIASLAFATFIGLAAPLASVHAEKCPAGSVQAGAEINKQDGNGKAQAVNLKKQDGTNSGKTGYITSIAQCNLSADDLDSSNDNNDVMKVVQQIINVVLGVLGLVAVIVIIIGGFYYITSSGDAAKLAKAKNTILYGIIGLIIALLAYAIVNFVLKSVFA